VRPCDLYLVLANFFDEKSKRRVLCLGFGLVVGLGCLAVWLEPTRVLWGLLRGENFFEGRPTSYWSGVLAASEEAEFEDRYLSQPGPPDWLEELTNKLGLRNEPNPRWRKLEGQPAATPCLLDLTNDRNSFVRWLALQIFCRMPVDNNEKLPVLGRALQDADLDVRLEAAMWLVQLGSRDSELIPVLIEGLKHENPMARFVSMDQLAVLGSAAKSAVPLLLEAWKQGDFDAGRALQKIDPDVAARAGVP